MRPPPTGNLATPAAPASRGADEPIRLTVSFVGLAVYLWVIHSAKAPIASYAIGLGLFGLVLRPQHLRLPAPLLWFGAFVLWTGASSALSAQAEFSSERITDFVKLWLIFLVACNVPQNRRQLYALIVVWLGIYALYPVRGTMFNFFAGIGEFGRYAWNHSFSNPNDLAGLTLIVLALAVAVLQGTEGRGWIRLSALAGVVVLPALIFVTQSRGGILALVTMGLLILVQYRRKARGLAIAVLVAGVVALVAPPEAWSRLGGVFQAGDTSTLRGLEDSGSAEQRWEIWRVAGAIAADNPVTGIGLGQYRFVHARYAARGPFLTTARGERDAHSMYLTVLAETGIPGLLIFLGMIGTVFLQGHRIVRALKETDPAAARQVSTLLIGLLAFLQAGLFGTLHRVAFLYVYLGILAAAVVVLAPALAGRGRLAAAPRVPHMSRRGVTSPLMTR